MGIYNVKRSPEETARSGRRGVSTSVFSRSIANRVTVQGGLPFSLPPLVGARKDAAPDAAPPAAGKSRLHYNGAP